MRFTAVTLAAVAVLLVSCATEGEPSPFNNIGFRVGSSALPPALNIEVTPLFGLEVYPGSRLPALPRHSEELVEPNPLFPN